MQLYQLGNIYDHLGNQCYLIDHYSMFLVNKYVTIGV